MTISFYPRRGPRTPASPESVKAWGSFVAAALGGLAAVLTALGAVGAGCVAVRTNDPQTVEAVDAMRKEVRKDRLARDAEIDTLREATQKNYNIAKFAKDKALANEVSIESHHPDLTKRGE